MKIKLSAIVGLTLIVFAACSNTANATKETKVVKAAVADKHSTTIVPALPAFKITGMDGNSINLADLKGKKIFVNLWAS